MCQCKKTIGASFSSMQMFLGQKDPMQSWPVQNGQCKVETNPNNSISKSISEKKKKTNKLFFTPNVQQRLLLLLSFSCFKTLCIRCCILRAKTLQQLFHAPTQQEKRSSLSALPFFSKGA